MPAVKPASYYREYRAKRRAEGKVVYIASRVPAGVRDKIGPRVPPWVKEEAERVRFSEWTPNMIVLGDPPPGRSMLDKRRASIFRVVGA